MSQSLANELSIPKLGRGCKGVFRVSTAEAFTVQWTLSNHESHVDFGTREFSIEACNRSKAHRKISQLLNCSLVASKTTVDCLFWSVGSGQEEMNDLPRLVAALQSQVGR